MTHSFTYTATVTEWRGPAPFWFAPAPAHLAAPLREAARRASYGWGVIPVTAEVAGIAFTTSLFPRAGSYWLPLKDKVRRAAGVACGDELAVSLMVAARSAERNDQ